MAPRPQRTASIAHGGKQSIEVGIGASGWACPPSAAGGRPCVVPALHVHDTATARSRRALDSGRHEGKGIRSRISRNSSISSTARVRALDPSLLSSLGQAGGQDVARARARVRVSNEWHGATVMMSLSASEGALHRLLARARARASKTAVESHGTQPARYCKAASKISASRTRWMRGRACGRLQARPGCVSLRRRGYSS